MLPRIRSHPWDRRGPNLRNLRTFTGRSQVPGAARLLLHGLRMHVRKLPQLAIAVSALAVATAPAAAYACGCFAPPNPSVPVVQAGERILFAYEDGKVIAHIQIQYAGGEGEFGWLVPVPSVPEFDVSTDELFTQLIAQTQPRYTLNTVFPDACGTLNGGFGRGGVAFESDSGAPGADEDSPLVVEGSVGPFDYAVLKADDEQEMLEWLDESGYIVPAGLDDPRILGPYIYEGGYFLALKLRAGESTGNIQPVKLVYESDYPMIPIILTSVAADPNMGVQVWVVGEHRAIPRNYRHTILNDEKIDWFNFGQNYNDVIIEATNEAPGGQSFVTEYAGPSDVMEGQLNWDGRFGTRSLFQNIEDPVQYVATMNFTGFPLTSAVQAIMEQTVPFPAGLTDQVSPEGFYTNVEWYMGSFREQRPELFQGYELPEFDPIQTTRTLWERVVEPTRDVANLIANHPKMTRMYTTLSPHEMTKDPVFAFSSQLPDVSNQHDATFYAECEGSAGVLELPDGRRFEVDRPGDWQRQLEASAPFSLRIEELREDSPTNVLVDNAARISAGVGSGGCTCAQPRGSWGALAVLPLLAVGLLLRRRRGV